ncbi:Cell shape-determining protein MreB [Fusobacterium sp. DD29]|uniref:rod shape-determining protein n=1 Tax=unclassified Fusobacterium TaxID=2648384 RepID=UPI001B8C6890|nr:MULTISPECIES: rod shape-determining protein [unclassified Fusobacterium]MBR8701989.1 Cell shape-determining protein MreB [Fusobacterium sp. DD45]MBR8711796.1 Cell shape-determining protein MreB [Fusobacterium sp. DD28]MBR8750210.1 Cell shape-determining protein MreB [Fusobacterium sp. DD29]MBR8752352.1 Cell shape-determining protein MreB [Fusobacterium sp. DD26]MBR8762452.1 Cell shape-determining protein MreB [Fusobacterium sp. DD25]
MKFKFPSIGFNRSLGIDLGTANTLVYSKKHRRIVLNEPSVVAVEKESRKILAVGNEAKEMLGKTPDSIVAVKPLSEGVIADYDVTEAMIKYFIRKVFGSYSFFMPEIMICVPIDVTGVEKRAVLEAAISAGAKRAYLIEEARAAALGSGMDISVPEGNMIIDIGGGSTDVAVISLGGTVISKTIRTAGNNFDADIVKYVKKTHNLLIGDKTAEEIKIKIGTALPLEEEEKMIIKGRDLIMGLPKTVEISSEEVREAIQDSLMEIVECVKYVLEQTPPELASDIIDKGMIMAGGGSLIRNFPEMIAGQTHLQVKLAENPLESVVRGAGLALDQLKVLRQIEKAER